MVLTGLELFNDPVPIRTDAENEGAEAGLTLDRSITVADAITLDHLDSVITFEFAGLSYASPDRIQYAYKLSGWDSDWLVTDAKRRSATYTNLPAGTYEFQVRAANGRGEWGPPTAPLAVSVLPAPWRTWWAYALYAIAALGLLAALIWTLHRRAEEQRQRAEREEAINEQLRRVDRLKDEFLANTSHELRTPLHGMIGIAESLIDGATGQLPLATARNLSMIVSSGRRLGSLIDDVLDFSKLKNESLTLARRPVDLRSLVDVVLTLTRPLAADKRLALVNDVPVDLASADADENRVEQILHNLIGNAVKFTQEGDVRVSAQEHDGMIAVTVRDTGIGISADDQERIFVSFEQVEGDTERSYSGTGLGLAISRQLVELHGGSLTVESQPGEGSAFTFTLPVASERAARADRDRVGEIAPLGRAVASGELATVVGENGDGEQFKVLVVDDEPVNRQVLVNQLALHNYRIVEASGGEEALEAFEREAPDLVLLDIMMPRMSGYDVCRKLREERDASQMPIIYLSAKNQVRDLLEGFDTGANDYLMKPITKSELLARVRTHLELLDVHRNLERKVAERTEELRDANEKLEQLAALDGLTGISNRRIFDERIEVLWRDHIRREAPLSLLLIDVDHFKSFNDRYGHQRGDTTLVAVARAVVDSMRRASDLAARFGGEEFAVILPDTDEDGAMRIAETVLHAARSLEIEHEESSFGIVTLSIGVASMNPERGGELSALIGRADQALYSAKQKGRDRIEVWAAMPSAE